MTFCRTSSAQGERPAAFATISVSRQAVSSSSGRLRSGTSSRACASLVGAGRPALTTTVVTAAASMNCSALWRVNPHRPRQYHSNVSWLARYSLRSRISASARPTSTNVCRPRSTACSSSTSRSASAAVRSVEASGAADLSSSRELSSSERRTTSPPVTGTGDGGWQTPHDNVRSIWSAESLDPCSAI